MRVKLLIASLLFASLAQAHDVGEMVKCQGYVERPDEDRTYYELKGKILKVLGRHYMIYGYTPVFKRKRLHKVLKISCVLPDEEFIAEVKEIKEEIVDQPVIQVSNDPGINTDVEEGPAPEIKENVNEKIISSAVKENSDASDSFKPIDDEGQIEIDPPSKKDALPDVKEKTVKAPSAGCKKLTGQGILNIIKCFMKDGYGSF